MAPNAALLALGLAPAVLMIYTVVSIWLPLPYWDEWTTPAENLVSWCNGTLTWQELFSQHNESRKFFPRLLYLGLAQLGGWDVRKEMTLTLLTVSGTAFLFFLLIRRTPGATTRSALIVFIGATLLCFSPVQLENLLWGIQLEVFFPGLALLLIATVNLSNVSLPRKCALNALLALLGTYTVAHGMLLWVLGIPLLARGESGGARRSLLVYGTYLLFAAAAITPYFVGYHRPPHHPEMLAGEGGVLRFAHYLILWVGSYFNSSVANPFAVGLPAVAIFSVCLVGSAFLIQKRGNWRTFYPGFMIAGYASATALITAFGRIGFGAEQALNIRYRSYSLFFYLAIVALLFAIYCSYFRTGSSVHRRLFLGAASIAALAAFVGWVGCYVDGLKQQKLLANRNLTLLRALEWIEAIPDNPDLRFLFPFPGGVLDRTRILRQHRMLRLAFVPDSLAHEMRKTFQLPDDDAFGRLETCVIDPNRNLRITGRAWLPDQNRPPDCVVIGAVDPTGIFKPISIAETQERRATGGNERPREKRDSFGRTLSPTNLPPGSVSLAAVAVDLRGKQAHTLGGITQIPPPAP